MVGTKILIDNVQSTMISFKFVIAFVTSIINSQFED